MKTTKLIAALLFFTFISISCGKLVSPKDDDTNSKSGNKVSGTMTAILDGTDWKAKTVVFGGLFATQKINGQIDDSNLISLEFSDTDLVINKTYQFDLKNLEANILGNLVVIYKGKNLFAKSGTFTFSKYKRGSQVKGEFSAELSNFVDTEISLKNCKFDMEYK